MFEFRNSWIKEGDASAEGGFFQPELPDPSWHPMPLTPSSFWKLFQQLESLELPLGDTSRCGTSASTPSPHPLSCPASAAPKDKRMIYSQNTSRACLLFCFVFLNKRSFSQLSQRIMEGDSKVLQLVQQGRVKGRMFRAAHPWAPQGQHCCLCLTPISKSDFCLWDSLGKAAKIPHRNYCVLCPCLSPFTQITI